MKTTYIKYLFITVFSALILFPGCEKFLDKELQGQLTQENFPVTAGDALLATNAAYASLREWHYNSGGYPILDIMSINTWSSAPKLDENVMLPLYSSRKYSRIFSGLI